MSQRDAITQVVCRVTPNAHKSECVGWGSDEQSRPILLLKLAAPALEGKANKELLRFIADHLDCSKSEIALIKGDTSRTKVIAMSSKLAQRLQEKTAR